MYESTSKGHTKCRLFHLSTYLDTFYYYKENIFDIIVDIIKYTIIVACSLIMNVFAAAFYSSMFAFCFCYGYYNPRNVGHIYSTILHNNLTSLRHLMEQYVHFFFG
ncbi:MAG: hypothetical protein MHMPM18_002715 [Marteilia pararefringens]